MIFSSLYEYIMHAFGTHKNRAFLCLAEKMMGPVHCSCDLQIFFFIKNNFKTESHDTIHIFKIYFVTVFLVFSNKRYPN